MLTASSGVGAGDFPPIAEEDRALLEWSNLNYYFPQKRPEASN